MRIYEVARIDLGTQQGALVPQTSDPNSRGGPGENISYCARGGELRSSSIREDARYQSLGDTTALWSMFVARSVVCAHAEISGTRNHCPSRVRSRSRGVRAGNAIGSERHNRRAASS